MSDIFDRESLQRLRAIYISHAKSASPAQKALPLRKFLRLFPPDLLGLCNREPFLTPGNQKEAVTKPTWQ